MIRELVGLIVLGVVAKDIVVLEHGRLGLASRLFGCRLGCLVELRSGFLLGYDFGIGRGGDFDFGLCCYSNSDFDLCLGFGFRTAPTMASGSGRLTCLGRTAFRSFLPRFFFL